MVGMERHGVDWPVGHQLASINLGHHGSRLVIWVAIGARNLGVEDALKLICRLSFGGILTGGDIVGGLEATTHTMLLVHQQLHVAAHDRLLYELLKGVSCAQNTKVVIDMKVLWPRHSSS